MANYTRRLLLFALLIWIACSSAPKQKPGHIDSTKTQLITIRPGVNLEIVDWGGEGSAMVFLAGLGHTAHVFADFAPRFTDGFRVLGITRRGFGASSQPASGYSIDTLVDDIRFVLDSLQLEKVILIGHSLGGDEITEFASKYPGRANALIYIEGAYDRVTTGDSLENYPVPEMSSPEPTPEELKSAEAYRGFYTRANGVRMPLSEIRAMYNWNDDGSFAGGKTPGWIYSHIRASLRNPVYDSITLPALAIYAVAYPIEELFMDFDRADTASQRLMTARYEATVRLAAMSRIRFQDLMQNGTAVIVRGAGHSLYITHADRVEREIRSFLQNLR